MTDIQNAFGDIGGAVGDIFSAVGAAQSADSYRKAAAIAGENVDLSNESTGIKAAQESRKAYQTISGQQADVAGAGFSAGGSAGDLFRSSAEQAALTQGQIQLQGSIEANAYRQQQTAYTGQAESADTAAAGDIFGSIFKIAGAVLPFLPLLLL